MYIITTDIMIYLEYSLCLSWTLLQKGLFCLIRLYL